MQTYNLITTMNGDTSGIESFTARDSDDAVAYASGILAERTKGHLEMFAGLKVRWSLDQGVRTLGDITAASGPVIGSWQPVRRDGLLEVVWKQT